MNLKKIAYEERKNNNSLTIGTKHLLDQGIDFIDERLKPFMMRV